MYSRVAAFLVLFAVVSAQGIGSIVVKTQNGDTIVVNQNTQRQVRIATNPLSTWGTETIKVQVTGPAVPPNTIHIADQQVDVTGAQQSDILNQVLSTFNGLLGEGSYEQLLNVVAQQVATGKVNPIVLNALQIASNNEQIVQLGVQQLIQNQIQQQGQWQQGLIGSHTSGLLGAQQVEQALINQASSGNPLAQLAVQNTVEQQLLQGQEGLQGPLEQGLINKKFAAQQAKQALISQALRGTANPLASAQAEIVLGQALGASNPQSQLAKQALINQVLAYSGNPLDVAQAELVAEQTLVADDLQSQLVKKIVINQALAQSGNPVVAAQAEIEAENAAQILAAIESQNQMAIGTMFPFGATPLLQTGRLSPHAQIQLASASGQVFGPSIGSPLKSHLAEVLGLSQVRKQAAAARGRGVPITVY